MNGWWGVALGVLLSFAVNEVCEVSPWLAKRIVPLAARLWTSDSDRREVYTESWLAVISDRPGKLLKLGTALGLLGGGAVSGLREKVVSLRYSPSPRVRALARVIGPRLSQVGHVGVILNVVLWAILGTIDEFRNDWNWLVTTVLVVGLAVTHSSVMTWFYIRWLRHERDRPAPSR